MWFTQEAPARLIEASDDLGQSLVPEAAGLATRLSDDAHFAFYGGSGVTQARTEFRLRLTDHPGRVARLRGVVPVMLHLRRPEPTLVIPLADAAGKTFRCDDAEFTIQTVNDSPTATNVSMTVRLNVDKADLPDNPDGELITTRLQVMGEHQLQLTDAAGTVLAYSDRQRWRRRQHPVRLPVGPSAPFRKAVRLTSAITACSASDPRRPSTSGTCPCPERVSGISAARQTKHRDRERCDGCYP